MKEVLSSNDLMKTDDNDDDNLINSNIKLIFPGKKILKKNIFEVLISTMPIKYSVVITNLTTLNCQKSSTTRDHLLLSITYRLVITGIVRCCQHFVTTFWTSFFMATLHYSGRDVKSYQVLGTWNPFYFVGDFCFF